MDFARISVLIVCWIFGLYWTKLDGEFKLLNFPILHCMLTYGIILF